MLGSHLFLFKFGFNESQSGILVLSPKYTSPTTSTNTWSIFFSLTVVVAYYLKQPEKQGYVYTIERLKGKKKYFLYPRWYNFSLAWISRLLVLILKLLAAFLVSLILVLSFIIFSSLNLFFLISQMHWISTDWYLRIKETKWDFSPSYL